MINRLSFHITQLIIDTALFPFPTNSFIGCPHVSLELKTIPKYLESGFYLLGGGGGVRGSFPPKNCSPEKKKFIAISNKDLF